MSRRAWFLMAVLAATWGASYLFIKVGLRDFSEGFIVFARTALAALVLLPFALRRGTLGQLRGRTGDVAFLSVIQVAGPFLLITFGENHIPSALAGILVASAPIFTAVLAIFLDPSERSNGWGLAGVGVGILGVALLFGVDLAGETMALVGGAMVLVAGLCYALGAMELKRRLSGTDPIAVAASTMVGSTVLVLPLALVDLPSAASAESVASVAALGVMGTGVAFGLFFTLISEVGPAKSSLVAYLAPAFAVAYGVALLDEVITAGTLGGLVLILAGSYLGAEGRLPWQRRRAPAAVEPPAAAEPVPSAEDVLAGRPELSRT